MADRWRREKFGVDNKQYSEGVGGQFGGVNAPTVYNAKGNVARMPDIAVFSDELRDGLYGPVWEKDKGAFLAGVPVDSPCFGRTRPC